MFRIEANATRNDQPVAMPGQFINPATAKLHVVDKLRGVGSYWQAWILNSEGERVVRGHRAGPGGTGETWAWHNLDGDDNDRD